MLKGQIVWSDTLLRLTLEQEEQIYLNARFSPAMREEAYRRAEAKRWFDTLIAAPHLTLDLNDLEPRDAAEVAQLRNLVGFGTTPPWHQKELAA